jgi:hypothetical protein
MQLSLMRANSVYREIGVMKFPKKAVFQNKVLAAGRGELDASQKIDDSSDRRVMFRFQFRGERFFHWFQNEKESL